MSDNLHAPTVTSGGITNIDSSHGAHGSGEVHDDHSHDDHGGLGKYVVVFVILCLLTSASVFTYSDLWPWKETPQVGRLFMMVVSSCKALLVILFFMHVKYEANWKYVLTIPCGLMSIFLICMLMPDVMMRRWWYSDERANNIATVQDQQLLHNVHTKSSEHATETPAKH